MSRKTKIKNFYGYYSSGASFLSEEKKFFSKRNIKVFDKEILNNCKRLGLNHANLSNKIIMNVGSGREALGFLQFNPKKIYHYDISKKNVSNFKKIVKSKKLSDKINSKQLDLSKNMLPKKKFDLVYLHGVIQHVDHVGKAIKNISNSLKKNGILWFYFYRPGSFINLLIMIQRFLVKKININDFCKKLDKQKYNFRFKDGIMDDCFVPNIQFFYPKDYLEYLRKLNFEIFGANLYTRTSKKYDFHKFHASVIFFLKKISNKKISNKYKDYLSPSDNIDVLDHKIYNKNKKIKDILKMLYKNESEIIDDNFKKVIMIQKLKINITKKYFDSYFLNKAYISNTLEKVKKILQ